jgi:hypothetical protein
MNNAARLAIAASLFVVTSLAHGKVITWALNGTFDDGGTVTGSYNWDADTLKLGAYEFKVSGGTTPILSTAFSYRPDNTIVSSVTSDGGVNVNTPSGTIRQFFFNPLLTLTDDAIPSPIKDGQESQIGFVRHLVSGTLSPVPEPSSVGFIGVGIGLFMFLRKRLH